MRQGLKYNIEDLGGCYLYLLAQYLHRYEYVRLDMVVAVRGVLQFRFLVLVKIHRMRLSASVYPPNVPTAPLARLDPSVHLRLLSYVA